MTTVAGAELAWRRKQRWTPTLTRVCRPLSLNNSQPSTNKLPLKSTRGSLHRLILAGGDGAVVVVAAVVAAKRNRTMLALSFRKAISTQWRGSWMGTPRGARKGALRRSVAGTGAAPIGRDKSNTLLSLKRHQSIHHSVVFTPTLLMHPPSSSGPSPWRF